jgi:hypothetical protein
MSSLSGWQDAVTVKAHGFGNQKPDSGATRHLIARPLVKPFDLFPRQSQAKGRAKRHWGRKALANGNPIGYDAQARRV